MTMYFLEGVEELASRGELLTGYRRPLDPLFLIIIKSDQVAWASRVLQRVVGSYCQSGNGLLV